MKENKDKEIYISAPIIHFLPSHETTISYNYVYVPLYKIVSR